MEKNSNAAPRPLTPIETRRIMKQIRSWTIRQYANHYAHVLKTGAPIGDTFVSPIFGCAYNVLLLATIRFGEEKVNEVFTKTLERKAPAT